MADKAAPSTAAAPRSCVRGPAVRALGIIAVRCAARAGFTTNVDDRRSVCKQTLRELSLAL